MILIDCIITNSLNINTKYLNDYDYINISIKEYSEYPEHFLSLNIDNLMMNEV